MQAISSSGFEEPFKRILLQTLASTMKEVLGGTHIGSDMAHLESLAGEAILALASTGQTSPGQLQRYAVSQVKSFLLTQSADRMFNQRSRSPASDLRARRIP